MHPKKKTKYINKIYLGVGITTVGIKPITIAACTKFPRLHEGQKA